MKRRAIEGGRSSAKGERWVINPSARVDLVVTSSRRGVGQKRGLAATSRSTEELASLGKFLELVGTSGALAHARRNRVFWKQAVETGLIVERAGVPRVVAYDTRLDAGLAELTPHSPDRSKTGTCVLNPSIRREPGADTFSVASEGAGVRCQFTLSPEHAGLLRSLKRGVPIPTGALTGEALLLRRAGLVVDTPRHAVREKDWQVKLERARVTLRDEGYVVLPGLLSPLHVALLRRYLRALAAEGHFWAAADDVERREWLHNEPVLRLIHPQITRVVNRLVPQRVRASYAFVARYLGKARLPRHIDRPQCAWNLSLLVDWQPPAVWPLYLDIEGRVRPARLRLGDGVLYRGCQYPHWRRSLGDGHSQTVCLFHFVSRSFRGPLD